MKIHVHAVNFAVDKKLIGFILLGATPFDKFFWIQFNGFIPKLWNKSIKKIQLMLKLDFSFLLEVYFNQLLFCSSFRIEKQIVMSLVN